MPTDSNHPVVIITGAGSGIGRAVCEQLAGAQCRLVLVGRTESKLAQTMDAIAAASAAPPDMLVVPADQSDAEQARSVIDMTLDRFARVDALVNNAGVAPSHPITETNEDLLYRTFAVNAFGPAYLIAAVWPALVKRKQGRIVNVSSRATTDPLPGFFVYAASKCALESLTRSAFNEGREHGILSFSVSPGAVETAMLRAIISEKVLPKSKALDPADVARVVCDCVLGRRDADAGAVIHVPSP